LIHEDKAPGGVHQFVNFPTTAAVVSGKADLLAGAAAIQVREDRAATPGQPLFFQQDAAGNTASLTNLAQQPVERYSYDAFGVPRIEDQFNNPIPGALQSQQGNPFLLGGAYWNGATQLYEQAYNPDQGRAIAVIGGAETESDIGFYTRWEMLTFCIDIRPGCTTNWMVPGLPWYPAFGADLNPPWNTSLSGPGLTVVGPDGEVWNQPSTTRSMPIITPILDDRGYGGPIPSSSAKEKFKRVKVRAAVSNSIGNGNTPNWLFGGTHEMGHSLGNSGYYLPPQTAAYATYSTQNGMRAVGPGLFMNKGEIINELPTTRGNKLYVGGLSFAPEINDEVLVAAGGRMDGTGPGFRFNGSSDVIWVPSHDIALGNSSDVIWVPSHDIALGSGPVMPQPAIIYGADHRVEPITLGYIADMPIRRPKGLAASFDGRTGHVWVTFGYIADMPIR
jgi:hypothetical protein